MVGDHASGGSGTLGPVQGPARPGTGSSASPAAAPDVLRMKPTHLRVHRPTGPRGSSSYPASAVGHSGGALRGRSALVGGVKAKAKAAASLPSVPRPAGSAFLTPRSARGGAGAVGSSSRCVCMYVGCFWREKMFWLKLKWY